MTTPKRILFIENDPHLLRAVPRRLKLAGYEVITAASSEAAYDALAEELFHLAIIDIRVDDDRSVSDTSGFAIARQLPDTIPCIFHTAHDSKENIREALGAIGADDIIAKDDPEAPAKLVSRVNELFAAEVGVNFDLCLESPLSPTAIADQIRLASSGPQPAAGDVELLFQRLFVQARLVHVKPLLAAENANLSQSGAALLKVQEERAQGATAPVVLKLGDRAEITDEVQRYRTIKPFLGGQRLAQLEGESYSRSIGGVVYSLVGAQEDGAIHTLGEVLLTQEPEAMMALLQRFFHNTFGRIYMNAQPAELDLTAHYTEALHLTAPKLMRAMAPIWSEARTAPTLPMRTLDRALPNPLAQVLVDNEFRAWGATPTRCCLVHGDLHSRNILVDEENQFWLIDFARSGSSHILRDLVELETDIKFRVLPELPLSALVNLEHALAESATWMAPMPVVALPDPLDRAFALVCTIRQIAGELSGLDPLECIKQYEQALFWHTLNLLRFKTTTKQRQWHGLVAAALLAEKFSGAGRG